MMSLQQIQEIELGEIKVSDNKTLIFSASNVGTGIVLVIYDVQKKVGGMAHIVLPESSLSPGQTDNLPAKYADKAIPALLDEFQELGGQLRNATVKIIGGAQLFNFGGGGGNFLNVGARNATAIRAALSKHGLAIEKADTGGNKSRAVRLIVATGQVYIRQIGGSDYQL